MNVNRILVRVPYAQRLKKALPGHSNENYKFICLRICNFFFNFF